MDGGPVFMKALFIASIVVAVLSLAIAVCTIPVESRYASRAKSVQRVLKNDADALFGESGTPVGSPQELIIDDPKAFTGGEEKGVAIVDESYLTSHKIYPLQLKTVRYVAGMTRLGAFIGLLVSLIAAWLLQRRIRSKSAEPRTLHGTHKMG